MSKFLKKTPQAVATVFYGCVTETPLSPLGTPIPQGFVDVFGGRAQYSSKRILDVALFDT